MYNPYQRKLIGDIIMNTLLSVLLVINLLPVNIGARIIADETPSTEQPTQEVGDSQKENDVENNTDGEEGKEGQVAGGELSGENNQQQEEGKKEDDDIPGEGSGEKENAPEEGSGGELPGENGGLDEENPAEEGEPAVNENDKVDDKKEEEEIPEVKEEDKKEEKPLSKAAKAGGGALLLESENGEKEDIVRAVTAPTTYNFGKPIDFGTTSTIYYYSHDGATKLRDFTCPNSCTISYSYTEDIGDDKYYDYHLLINGQDIKVKDLVSSLPYALTIEKGTGIENDPYVFSVKFPVVTFNSNGGSDVASQTVNSNGKVTKPSDPSKEGMYIFGGWYAPNATTPFDFENTTIDSDITLTAYWVTAYPITYAVNGGTMPSEYPVVYNADDAAFVLDVTPTRNDHEFLGWTGSNGDIPEKVVTIPQGTTGALNYTANWATIYKITYTVNGGTMPSEYPTTYNADSGAVVLEVIPTKSGSNQTTFLGWTGSNGNTPQRKVTISQGTTGALSYTANWGYKLTLKPNGGTLPEEYPVGYNSSYNTFNVTPIREGYDFGGWRRNGTTSQNPVTIYNVSGEKTYTAVWSPKQYAISYDLNHGKLPTGKTNRESYTIETNTFTLNNPTREGYIFVGWTGSNGETPQTTVTITKGSTGAKEYTANWEIDTYTISYELNGGTYEEIDHPVSYTVNTETFTLVDPEYEGYAFIGWTWEGQETPVESANVKIKKGSTGDRFYTANWEGKPLEVTFEPNGGKTPNPVSKTVYYGSKYEELASVERDGYHFVGWFTSTSSEGVQVFDTTDVTTYGAQTLYAIWQINASSLDYTDEGDVVEINDAPEGTIYNDFGKPVIINTPTGSTIIPALGNGEAKTLNNYQNAASDTHLHTLVGYGSEKTHYIDLIVKQLESETDKALLLEEARKSGFSNATEYNTLLFEAHVEVDGVETQIDGSMIISLKLPDTMRVVSSLYNREFRVFHKLSNGTVKEEPIVVLDLANGIIKIKVTELSPFAIAFRDRLKPSGDSGHVLPVTGITVDDGGRTMKLLSMVALIAVGMAIKMRDKVGKDYWEEFK